MNNEKRSTPHILVVGGGFGGLETALYLRRRVGESARITLVSDREAFTFRPHLVYVPFGLNPDHARLDLRALAASKEIVFICEHVEGVDPGGNRLILTKETVEYDYLVIATGAGQAPSEVPGLQAAAHAIWRERDLLQLRMAFEQLRRQEDGESKQVVFLVPPGTEWAGPLYEMAFMLAQWLGWSDARSASSIRFLTHEQHFMEALSPEIHDLMDNEFGHYGIEAETKRHVMQVDGKRLIFTTGEDVEFDLLIAAPTYRAAFNWKPLPCDARGFIRTVPATRQVQGWEQIYAVGDTSDYPVKQAFLALLQADAAAEHLASRVLDTEPDFAFEPSGLWVMDQFGQALFAHVPLDEAGSIDASADNAEAFVEMIPPGLLRRIALRDYLPSQDQFNNPLYAGLLWKGLRKGMGLLSYLTKQPSA